VRHLPAQGIEGISLACTFLDAGYGRLKYALFSAVFILITPIGIGAASTSPLPVNGMIIPKVYHNFQQQQCPPCSSSAAELGIPSAQQTCNSVLMYTVAGLQQSAWRWGRPTIQGPRQPWARRCAAGSAVLRRKRMPQKRNSSTYCCTIAAAQQNTAEDVHQQVAGSAVSSIACCVCCQGTLNSISAGILLYNGIVDLLLPAFGCVPETLHRPCFPAHPRVFPHQLRTAVLCATFLRHHLRALGCPDHKRVSNVAVVQFCY
jgi:hypothetical protein